VAEGEVEAGLVVVVKTASVVVVIVLLVVVVEIVEVVAAVVVVVVVVSRENKSCSLKERFLRNQIAIYVNVFLGLKNKINLKE
jgi:hypothetical protein